MSEIFHSITAKLLYIMKRARPDIETTVAYLCTRVSKSNEDDWKKLRRLLCYCKGTINKKCKIRAKNIGDIYTWVDAAHGVYNNMHSQTGGCMSLGHGTIHCKSSKQNLATKSSTETEIVGVSNYVLYNI